MQQFLDLLPYRTPDGRAIRDGWRLRMLRDAHGLSQGEVAHEMGIGASRISFLEDQPSVTREAEERYLQAVARAAEARP